MRIRLLISSLISAQLFFTFGGCTKEPNIKSDAIGQGFIKLNDLQIAIDFASINGPYVTLGCNNNISLTIWYGSTADNLNAKFYYSSNRVDGTFSNVEIILNDVTFCSFLYYPEITSDSYVEVKNVGNDIYSFKINIEMESCKTINLTGQYEGQLYFESKDCYGCPRPCSMVDDSYIGNVHNGLVSSIVNVNSEYDRSILSYDDNYKVASIVGPLFSYIFKYDENGLYKYYRVAREMDPNIDFKSQQGKIIKYSTSHFFGFDYDVTYLFYDNDKIIQSIDSVRKLVDNDMVEIIQNSFYEYDLNGNMIRKTIYIEDSLTAEYLYVFDDKINPFHGMYYSWEGQFTPVTLPNNVIEIQYLDYLDPSNSYTRKYEFTYDARGFPISIKGEYQKEQIEYYTYDF